MREKRLLLEVDDSIKDKAMKNRLSVIVDATTADISFHGDTASSLLKERAVEHISHAVADRIKFEPEICMSHRKRYYSSIFIFTEDELVSLIQFSITHKFKRR